MKVIADDLRSEAKSPARSGVRIGARVVNPYGVLSGLLIVVVSLLIVFPIGRMILGTFWDGNRLNLAQPLSVMTEPWFLPVVANSVVLVGVSGALALAVGSVLAWLNERTDANLGVVGLLLPLIPLLIPSIALAIGWVFIAAPRVGFLNGLLAQLPGLADRQISVNIYSWTGLIWLYTIHGVPYVYLVVSAALRNLDPALEEASIISGAGLLKTLVRVSLPAVYPSIIAAGLLVVISGFALYSLPVVVATTAQIDLLSVRLVRMLTNTYPPQIAQAQVVGLFMLVVLATLWFAQNKAASRARFVTVGGRSSGASRLPLGRWRVPAWLFMIGYLASVSIIPLLALVVVAFQPFWTPSIDLGTFTLANFNRVLFQNQLTIDAFRHSLTLAISGATVAMAIAAITAIYVVPRTGFLPRSADAVLKIPAVVPNLVIALSFLVTFSGPPFMLAGTPLLLVMAFIAIYIPPGSIAANAAVAQIGKDLKEASAISGAGDGRTVWKVIVPLAVPGLIAGWTIVFVHMMGDLSASALLAGVGNPVIGFVILEIWETGSFGQLAAFSSLMCLVICIVVGLTTWLVQSRTRNHRR